jgi:hypothetical protein
MYQRLNKIVIPKLKLNKFKIAIYKTIIIKICIIGLLIFKTSHIPILNVFTIILSNITLKINKIKTF